MTQGIAPKTFKRQSHGVTSMTVMTERGFLTLERIYGQNKILKIRDHFAENNVFCALRKDKSEVLSGQK